MRVPLWLDTVSIPEFSTLTHDLQVDVCIVGAGITGITLAYLLKDTDLKVALAKAYHVTGEKQYEALIEETISFINQHLFDDHQRLLARYRHGQSHYPGYLDDYAFYVYGLIESYQSTFNINYLQQAIELTEDMIKLFKDEEAGGFYLYGSDAENLMIRPKETYDGAMPSGNSVAAYNLIRLARLTSDSKLEVEATNQINFMANHATHYEISHAFYLIAAQFALSDSRELVAVISQPETVQEFKTLLSNHPLFNLTVVLKTAENETKLNDILPYLNDYQLSSAPSFYLCEGGSCQAPIHSLSELEKIL